MTCIYLTQSYLYGRQYLKQYFMNKILFFQVKEYCPLVFRNLRERFDIDDASYLKSLTKSPKSMGPSAGKSGAKFYLSQDKLYVIKTLESVEVEQMHSLLKQYHPFIVERHGK